VLGDRQVDPEDRRQMDQWMFDRRIGDVANDRRAGIEGLGGGVAGFLAACAAGSAC
jgi:hypothetical protein